MSHFIPRTFTTYNHTSKHTLIERHIQRVSFVKPWQRCSINHNHPITTNIVVKTTPYRKKKLLIKTGVSCPNSFQHVAVKKIIRTSFSIMNDKGAVLNNNTKDVSEYGGIPFIEACLVAMRIHLSRFFKIRSV